MLAQVLQGSLWLPSGARKGLVEVSWREAYSKCQCHMGLGQVYVTPFVFATRFSALGRAGERGRNGQEAGPGGLGVRREAACMSEQGGRGEAMD